MEKNHFSKNLKLLIKQKGLSQEEFASILNKGRSAIGSYVRGETEPNIDDLIRIAEYFGKNLNDLILTDISNKKHELPKTQIPALNKEKTTYNDKFDLLKNLFEIDNSVMVKKIDDLETIIAKFHFDLNEVKEELKETKTSKR